MQIEVNEKLLSTGLTFDEIIILTYLIEGNSEYLDTIFSNRLDDLKRLKDKLEGNLYIVQLPTKINLRKKLTDLLQLEVKPLSNPQDFYKELRVIFPTQGEVATTYPVRSTVADIKKKYDKYAKLYGWERDKVLKVAKKYVEECMDNQGGKFMKKCTNFIHLQDEGSLLATMYEDFDENNKAVVNSTFTDRL